MIEKSTLDFLNKLKKNNKKEWFDKNRPAYEEARQNIEKFIEAFLQKTSAFDPSVKNLVAKKCLFRINRDVRFSKDKSPYKTNFGASMNPGGKQMSLPGYYIHIEPGKSFIAGGLYMMEPATLNAVRQEIDYNLKAFESILGNKKFKSTFGGIEVIDKLQRPPKGYSEDNPALEHLKHKHYIVSADLSDKDLLSKDLVKKTAAMAQTMLPFLNFLKQALD